MRFPPKKSPAPKWEFDYSADWRSLFSFWRQDLVAGFTVAIVALPLALGFAITTGAPASMGITTAIIAGLIAALFGGSNYQVSGPTGAMTVVLVPIVAKYGLQSLVPIGIGAGILISLLGIFRFGRFIDSVPWPVMEGFTLGIAVIIALQQIPLIFEVDKAEGGHTFNVAIETSKTAFNQGFNLSAVMLVAMTLIIKFSWPKVKSQLGVKAHIPASIIALISLTFFAETIELDVNRIGELPRTLNLNNELSLNSYFNSNNLPISALLYAIIVVALLGAIESLLSARVADGMAHQVIDHEQVKHQPNKELLGQGLANIASAMVGGLPSTGAIARTGVNVRAGARTRLSAIFHACFLLFIILIIAPIVAVIPTAVLAGVLLGTSIRIANPRSVKEALTTTKSEAIVYLATAISVVVIDLIWGIAIGVAIHQIIKARKLKLQL